MVQDFTAAFTIILQIKYLNPTKIARLAPVQWENNFQTEHCKQ